MTKRAAVPESLARVPEHVLLSGVALTDLRLAYVPVPKAASTSVLVALSDLAGVDSEDRRRSRKLEVTRSATVHDGSLWDTTHRLRDKNGSELNEILRSNDWFRVTIVREPARRIWSAWVSKVLVRDPRFLEVFGEDWFPEKPASAADIAESFRNFVSELPDRPDWSDPHWSPQADLVGIGEIAYDLIGRFEALGAFSSDLDRYLAPRGATLPALGYENPSLLPFSESLFDADAHAACLRYTERDYEAFGYEPAMRTGKFDAQWTTRVESLVAAVRILIEHNERFLDLWRVTEASNSEPASRRTALFLHKIAPSLPFRGKSGTVSGDARLTRLALRHRYLVASGIALALLLFIALAMPEVLGDWPYDPRPSAWPATIEHL